jgi:hypothetical protein
MTRRTRVTIAVSCVVVGIVIIAMGVVILGIVFAEREDIDPQRVASFQKGLKDWGIDSQVEGAEEVCEFTGHGDEWYKLTISPNQIPLLRERLINEHQHMQKPPVELINDSVEKCIKVTEQISHPPSWWQPEALPDADAVRMSVHQTKVFIFSAQTGTVYLYFEGH